jgi:hypothetical protein
MTTKFSDPSKSLYYLFIFIFLLHLITYKQLVRAFCKLISYDRAVINKGPVRREFDLSNSVVLPVCLIICDLLSDLVSDLE